MTILPTHRGHAVALLHHRALSTREVGNALPPLSRASESLRAGEGSWGVPGLSGGYTQAGVSGFPDQAFACMAETAHSTREVSFL